MIHTISISYSMCCCDDFLFLAGDLYSLKNIGETNFRLFLFNKARKFYLPSVVPGITSFSFSRDRDNFDLIYVNITIDLQALTNGSLTLDLFNPTYDNVKELCYAYSEAILTIFPSLKRKEWSIDKFLSDEVRSSNYSVETLLYLPLAKVARIDYSLNLMVDEATKEETLEMVRDSFHDPYQKAVRFNNNNLHAENPKARKKSSKTKLYDKQRYYEEVATTAPIELKTLSGNILRYEFERDRNFKDFVQRKYKIPADYVRSPYIRSPITFFEADTCHKILIDNYLSKIGSSDWYGKDDYINIINQSDLSKHNKETIIKKIAPLIGYCGMNEALNAYIEGRKLPNGTKVKGTAATFRKYIKIINSLNIHPMMIKQRMKEKHRLYNPINNIRANTESTRREYDIPSHIKANNDRLLQHIWFTGLGRKCVEAEKAL